jgi:hypothetical protein
MKLSEAKKKLDEWFNSPEADEYFEKQRRKEVIHESQLERAHEFFETNDFETIVDRIIDKYSSDEYYERELIKAGREKRTELFWFLRDYAMRYGRECTNDEYEQHACMFTGDMYYINGYIFESIHGQGSFVRVIKVK